MAMVEGANFCAQTVQGAAIRNLFELLKDILIEGNFIATPHAIRLLAMDNSKSVVTSVDLQAPSFEHFFCKSPRVVLGLNLANMYKLVKSASNNDVVTLWTMPNEDVLHIRLENSERSSNTEYRLRLLDINETSLEVPSCDFQYVLSMSSSDFQRLCRDMAMLSTTVHIANDETSMTLTCNGEYADQQTKITQNQNLTIKKASTEPRPDASMHGEHMSCEYSLRYLIMFARGSSLSSTVDLFIQKGMPIILKYNAASLGRVLFCLGPLQP